MHLSRADTECVFPPGGKLCAREFAKDIKADEYDLNDVTRVEEREKGFRKREKRVLDE